MLVTTDSLWQAPPLTLYFPTLLTAWFLGISQCCLVLWFAAGRHESSSGMCPVPQPVPVLSWSNPSARLSIPTLCLLDNDCAHPPIWTWHFLQHVTRNRERERERNALWKQLHLEAFQVILHCCQQLYNELQCRKAQVNMNMNIPVDVHNGGQGGEWHVHEEHPC